MLTNPDKLSLSKETETFLGAFFPELASQVLKNPTDWFTLDILALLSFISV